MKLNKRFTFSQEFPVFSNIYDLAESSLSIGFHGGEATVALRSFMKRFEIFSTKFIFVF